MNCKFIERIGDTFKQGHVSIQVKKCSFIQYKSALHQGLNCYMQFIFANTRQETEAAIINSQNRDFLICCKSYRIKQSSVPAKAYEAINIFQVFRAIEG